MSTAHERNARLATLEAQRWAQMAPIDRAYARLHRGECYELLADDELDALLSVPDAQYLKALPTPLLEAILEQPESEPWLVSLQAAYADGANAFAHVLAQTHHALVPAKGNTDAHSS